MKHLEKNNGLLSFSMLFIIFYIVFVSRIGRYLAKEMKDKLFKRKEIKMARKRMKRSKDQKVFAHTAVKGKKINVIPSIPRGGIRM